MNPKIEAMDRFNLAIQREIARAEPGEPEVALELAQIKFNVNQQFHQKQEHAHIEPFLVSPV